MILNLYKNNLRGIEEENDEHNYQWELTNKLNKAYQKLLLTKTEEQQNYKVYYDKSNKKVEF